jgi:hypothetical protein
MQQIHPKKIHQTFPLNGLPYFNQPVGRNNEAYSAVIASKVPQYAA